MKIKIIKFREDLKWPIRKHYNDAGADVYIQESVRLFPNETLKVPLGFGLELPDGLVGYICDRSSMAVKGLICHLSPIDAGYRGEIHAIISNHSGMDIIIPENTRIAQLVILPTIYTDFVEELGEDRGEGGFGSTGESIIKSTRDDT